MSTLDQVRAAWDALAPRFDHHITPLSSRQGEPLMDRLGVGPGTRLLDVACGSGALAIPAARRGAVVTAVDLSGRMIDLLAVRARDARVEVDARVMDLHALALPDDAFDVTVSQHGVTMSPRLAVALTEMVRVTRPAGTVAVIAFGPLPQVEFLSIFLGAVRTCVPGFAGLPVDPPPPPFQLADRAVFARVLQEAGLHDVVVDRVSWDVPIASCEELWDTVISSNPIGARIVAEMDERERAQVRTELKAALQRRFGGRTDGVLSAAVNVGSGRVGEEEPSLS